LGVLTLLVGMMGCSDTPSNDTSEDAVYVIGDPGTPVDDTSSATDTATATDDAGALTDTVDEDAPPEPESDATEGEGDAEDTSGAADSAPVADDTAHTPSDTSVDASATPDSAPEPMGDVVVTEDAAPSDQDTAVSDVDDTAAANDVGSEGDTCLADCDALSCGDGQCDPSETPEGCPEDCQGACGDGVCNLTYSGATPLAECHTCYDDCYEPGTCPTEATVTVRADRDIPATGALTLGCNIGTLESCSLDDTDTFAEGCTVTCLAAGKGAFGCSAGEGTQSITSVATMHYGVDAYPIDGGFIPGDGRTMEVSSIESSWSEATITCTYAPVDSDE
jgi:hypothetical protein